MSDTDAPYLIPQTVFVGDRARLVIPLDSAFSDAEPVVLSKPEELPASADLIIHRIELEHRNGTVRLLIDFTGFAPGFLALPDFKIPSGKSGSFFLFSSSSSFPKGITIPIASILTGDAMVLSPPVPPLTVPGTALLVYGTTGTVLLLLLLLLGLRFWGRDRLTNWRTRFRRRRLLRLMGKALRSLRNELLEQKPGGPAEEKLLTRLSLEFRTFLSGFTGMYCYAMTAGEFISLSPLIAPEPERAYPPVLSGKFLCTIFRRCDTLRFSGTGAAPEELLGILEEIQQFIDVLNQAEQNTIRGTG